MRKNEYEQNGFVMDQNTQKLIGDAQAAFDILKKISDQFQTVANANQFTGNQEDDEFIEELASLNFSDREEDYDDYEDEDEDVAGVSYYGRGRGRGDCGCTNNSRRDRGCGCGCGCGCGKDQCQKPEFYPCECRECDKLKAKAYTNLVLGINDLKDAFKLLCLAKDKFDEAVDSIQDAQKLFEKARCCSVKFGCKCYCKTRRKGHCKHC